MANAVEAHTRATEAEGRVEERSSPTTHTRWARPARARIKAGGCENMSDAQTTTAPMLPPGRSRATPAGCPTRS